MGKYVDGFVLPVPKANVEAYRHVAEAAGKVWREYGALALHRVRCRRREARSVHVVPAEREARAG